MSQISINIFIKELNQLYIIVVVLSKFNNLPTTKFLRNKVVSYSIVLRINIGDLPLFSYKDNFIIENRCCSKRACVSFIELVVKFSLIVLSRRRDRDQLHVSVTLKLNHVNKESQIYLKCLHQERIIYIMYISVRSIGFVMIIELIHFDFFSKNVIKTLIVLNLLQKSI